MRHWSLASTLLAVGLIALALAAMRIPTVTLWSSQTGSQVFSLPPESGPIWSLAWSPDGRAPGPRLGRRRAGDGERARAPGSTGEDWPGVAS